MDYRKLNRRQLLKTAGALGVAAALLDPTEVLADEGDGQNGGGGRVTWDIVAISPPNINQGGRAGAKTEDGADITVSGHGTFPNVDRCSRDVTGGGTWTIAPGVSGDPRCFTGAGNYRVIELLSWHPASGGTLPPGLSDNTGDKGTFSSGLATLRVLYTTTTGEKRPGTLTVSCHMPNSPNCMFEGITATMVYEDFWNHDLGGVTLFHISRNGNGD